MQKTIRSHKKLLKSSAHPNRQSHFPPQKRSKRDHTTTVGFDIVKYRKVGPSHICDSVTSPTIGKNCTTAKRCTVFGNEPELSGRTGASEEARVQQCSQSQRRRKSRQRTNEKIEVERKQAELQQTAKNSRSPESEQDPQQTAEHILPTPCSSAHQSPKWQMRRPATNTSFR